MLFLQTSAKTHNVLSNYEVKLIITQTMNEQVKGCLNRVLEFSLGKV